MPHGYMYGSPIDIIKYEVALIINGSHGIVAANLGKRMKNKKNIGRVGHGVKLKEKRKRDKNQDLG